MIKILLSVVLFVSPMGLVLGKEKKIPAEIVQLIQSNQPYVFEAIISEKYDIDYVKKNFPEVVVDQYKMTYQKSDNNKINWWLSDGKKIKEIEFEFDTSKSTNSSANKKLLEKYKDKLSKEELNKLPSSKRTITIDDSSNGYKLKVFYPVSIYENPVIKSVVLVRGE